MSNAAPASGLPAWSGLLGATGYQTFMALVRTYFVQRNLSMQLDEASGVISTDSPSFPFRGTFGLQNLAQICKQSDRDEWHDLITRHFDTILATQCDIGAPLSGSPDFAKVRPSLRARLFPVEIAKQATELVCRPGPPGTVEVLAMDQPRAVRTVARSECEDWGLTEPELLNLGRRNLLAGGTLKAEIIQVERGATLHAFRGDHYYAASHALVIEEYLPDDLPYGALVGIPRRDLLLIHYVRNIGALEVIAPMLQVIVSLHKDGPGSITPNLFWRRAGEFVNLNYELADNTLSFSPPDEFVEMLNRLSSGAAQS